MPLKGKAKADSGEKKRPGNPGNFNGKRLQFLLDREEVCHESNGKTDAAFFQAVFAAYWEIFSWRLSLSEELPDDESPPPMDEIISEEDENQRRAMVVSTHLVSTFFALLRHV
jgi:hypothetical protein